MHPVDNVYSGDATAGNFTQDSAEFCKGMKKMNFDKYSNL